MPLSNEEVEAIAETMTILHYKKGTVLLKEGQISTEVYFVLDGFVRQYFLVDGEERTCNFFKLQHFWRPIFGKNYCFPVNL